MKIHAMDKDYSLKILFFGAEQSTYQLIQSLLLTMQDTHYTFHQNADADAALDHIQSGLYDLCLVDIPSDDDPTPWHFLERTQTLTSSIPIILLANSVDRTLDLRAIQMGAADFLVKPLTSADKLDRAIQYSVERSRFMNELKKHLDELSVVEALKTDMIRIAAHDLRGPIATILMSVELLWRLESEEAKQKHLQRIWDAARRMQRITSEILSLEHLYELQQSAPTTFDLREIVRDAYKTYQDDCANKALDYRLQLTDKPLPVRGFISQLQEAIQNLIENAIQYTPKGKYIVVRLASDDSWVLFEVEDQGIGVPEDEQKNLFQPFFRTATAQKVYSSGMGLGLYLVKRIITRNNGDIIFRSAPDKGSTFGFRLPIAVLNEVV